MTPSPSPTPLPEVVVHVAHHTDWIAVLTFTGSAIAAIGAAVAGTVAVLVFRQNQRDRHREHASRISVRAHFEQPGHDWSTHRNPSGNGAAVYNASDEPAYRCIPLFVHPVTGARLATGTPIDVLPPNSAEFSAPTAHGQAWLTRLNYEKVGYVVEVTFVDRNGRRWLRDRRGGLKELSAEPDLIDPEPPPKKE